MLHCMAIMSKDSYKILYRVTSYIIQSVGHQTSGTMYKDPDLDSRGLTLWEQYLKVSC